MVGFVVGILLLPLAAVVVAVGMNRPMFSEPPGFAKRLSIYLYYNVAETAANPLLPELKIRRYHVSEETMKSAVERTLRSLPRWKVVRQEGDLGAYQAEVTSRIWRFRDAVAILVTAYGPDEVEVYVHSASHVGLGDLGANRTHILAFYEELERQLNPNGQASIIMLDENILMDIIGVASKVDRNFTAKGEEHGGHSGRCVEGQKICKGKIRFQYFG